MPTRHIINNALLLLSMNDEQIIWASKGRPYCLLLCYHFVTCRCLMCKLTECLAPQPKIHQTLRPRLNFNSSIHLTDLSSKFYSGSKSPKFQNKLRQQLPLCSLHFEMQQFIRNLKQAQQIDSLGWNSVLLNKFI